MFHDSITVSNLLVFKILLICFFKILMHLSSAELSVSVNHVKLLISCLQYLYFLNIVVVGFGGLQPGSPLPLWVRAWSSSLSSYLLKIHFNIILPCAPRSSKWSLSLGFPYHKQNEANYWQQLINKTVFKTKLKGRISWQSWSRFSHGPVKSKFHSLPNDSCDK
jgi:hypothetical protein